MKCDNCFALDNRGVCVSADSRFEGEERKGKRGCKCGVPKEEVFVFTARDEFKKPVVFTPSNSADACKLRSSPETELVDMTVSYIIEFCKAHAKKCKTCPYGKDHLCMFGDYPYLWHFDAIMRASNEDYKEGKNEDAKTTD